MLVSSAAPGETVGGYFSLTFGTVGPTRRLRADFDASQLKTALTLDLGVPLAEMDISRSVNTYCGCTNAYQWTITFHAEGNVPTLQAQNYLTGNGATIGNGAGQLSAILVETPPIVAGFFALRYGERMTRDMPSNVDATTMALRLRTDLELPIRSVARSNPTVQNGFTWSITFATSATVFNPNPLEPAPVKLSGHEVLLSVTTVREGLATLYGGFRLRLGTDETPDIDVTSDAAQVTAALQSLDAVSAVSVTRSVQNRYGGYTWTVTFLEINVMTEYGLVMNSLGTLPRLVPITTFRDANEDRLLLLGSDARVLVEYAGESPSASSGVKFGNVPGESAGSATIFIPKRNQWIASAYLIGSDTHRGDHFGASVAVDGTGTKAVVGASYAVGSYICTYMCVSIVCVVVSVLVVGAQWHTREASPFMYCGWRYLHVVFSRTCVVAYSI
jgi:hypothetical protein